MNHSLDKKHGRDTDVDCFGDGDLNPIKKQFFDDHHACVLIADEDNNEESILDDPIELDGFEEPLSLPDEESDVPSAHPDTQILSQPAPPAEDLFSGDDDNTDSGSVMDLLRAGAESDDSNQGYFGGPGVLACNNNSASANLVVLAAHQMMMRPHHTDEFPSNPSIKTSLNVTPCSMNSSTSPLEHCCPPLDVKTSLQPKSSNCMKTQQQLHAAQRDNDIIVESKLAKTMDAQGTADVPSCSIPGQPRSNYNYMYGTMFPPMLQKQTQQACNTFLTYPAMFPFHSAFPVPAHPCRKAMALSLVSDRDQLSEYQVLVRQQLEVFEATTADVESNTQGRKKQILPGQVGLRCMHCAHLPLKARGRGAVYYPMKLESVYQAGQNMAGHLRDSCCQIPHQIRKELCKVRERRGHASSGKQYWADGCRSLGIYETAEDGLRLWAGAQGNSLFS
ncbi:hypothetical protein ACA910_018170 [Epithemia clementina (nom. ined.)]